MPVFRPPLPSTPNFGRITGVAVALLAALPPMPAVHAAGAVQPAPPMPRPPNLLFVISDDQSWRDTGIGGERTVRTPAFDRSAREGVRFTHAFCARPSCTPSRSAVLTGRHIWQIGEAGGRYGSLPKKFPVFPHLLQAAHYRTGFARKGWGPGECPAGGLASHPLGREYNEKLLTPRPHPALDARDYAENFQAFLRDRPAGAPFSFGSAPPGRIAFTKKAPDAKPASASPTSRSRPTGPTPPRSAATCSTTPSRSTASTRSSPK